MEDVPQYLLTLVTFDKECSDRVTFPGGGKHDTCPVRVILHPGTAACPLSRVTPGLQGLL